MTARGFFFTPAGALRAPWRIGVFLVATIVVAMLLQMLVYPLAVAIARPLGLQIKAYPWIEPLALLAGTAIALRRVDRRPWADVWMGREASRPGALARGTLLGALGIGVPTALLLATGWLRAIPAADGSSGVEALRLAFFLAPAALMEELLVRGYIFAVLRDALGWPWALTATSLVFGLLHLANPGADVQSIVMVTLAGFFLGVVLLALRSLYAAWAAHFAWNWVMAALYHVPVSGGAMQTPDYRVIDTGPDWATGGLWGPEGGLGAALGMLAGLAYLTAPFWRRHTHVHRETGAPRRDS